MKNILRLENVTMQFGGVVAVNNLSMEVNEGEIISLIGPNGAGKTTVFNILTGVYQPTEGTFYLNGRELRKLSQEKINHAGIARTFQNIRLFNNMTVRRNVMVGLHNRPEFKCTMLESMLRLPRHFKCEREMKKKAVEILEIFGLADERNTLACNLPYGKQRKLEIARAMATNPKLLLLDEPAAGMNPNETQELMDVITFIRKKFDVTILLIEHDMRLVGGICEKLTVLNFGTELAKGETSTVLNNPEVIKAYIGE